jgi:4-hydroxy-tetrahydrodipicolinate synthase
MITPFCVDGSVDYETARKYVRFYNEKGCDGIFSICQSSEIFYLSLEERVKLNKVVYDEVLAIEKESGRRMTVVSSGHISDSIDEQANELNEIIKSGTDALILITNRLDLNNEGDDVWIDNAKKLLSRLPSDVMLGLYECPYPYKRLLTPKILEWCKSTGRFKFIKDTCCDAQTIKERIEILDGSGIMLFNANCQTLLLSLKEGASGYCGIMANYHPQLYVWLYKNYKTDMDVVRRLNSFICTSGFTENGIPYPISAKYHMCLEGIDTVLSARKPCKEFTEYDKYCTENMRILASVFEKEINGEK